MTRRAWILLMVGCEMRLRSVLHGRVRGVLTCMDARTRRGARGEGRRGRVRLGEMGVARGVRGPEQSVGV